MRNMRIMAVLGLSVLVMAPMAARAEGEYQSEYRTPAWIQNNVGGGRVATVNTGDSSVPLAVIHLDRMGEQRPTDGRVATIQGGIDMNQPVYVNPMMNSYHHR